MPTHHAFDQNSEIDNKLPLIVERFTFMILHEKRNVKSSFIWDDRDKQYTRSCLFLCGCKRKWNLLHAYPHALDKYPRKIIIEAFPRSPFLKVRACEWHFPLLVSNTIVLTTPKLLILNYANRNIILVSSLYKLQRENVS